MTLNNRVAFKWAPRSLLDIYGAQLPLGFEYYFGERFGVSFDAGLLLYYVLNNRLAKPYKTVSADYKLRLDVRQYFRLREKSRLYAGAALFFRQQEMNLEDSYLHYVNGASFSYSGVNATKAMYGSGIFLGISRKLSEYFILKGHLGLGLRLLKMKTDLSKTGLVPLMESSFRSWIPPNEDRVGDLDLNIYLPFVIKIAYLF